MKGCMFRAEPKDRQHLVDDYRDPEPPPLPRPVPHELHGDSCPSIGSLSMRNVLSDPWLTDYLDQVGYTNKKRVIHDVDYIISKKEAILRRAKAVQERKNKRLEQRDIEQVLKSCHNEGYKLTHAIMLAFLERDVAMLQALKGVQPYTFTARGTLKTHRSGRFIISTLKQWEQALKERDRGKAASILLYLSLYFQNKEDPSYYWLIYELYHLALKSARGCKGHITEAVIQYMFGKFLLEKAKHFKEAEFHLERACNLSYGYNWTTAFVAPESNEHINDSGNYLLHILLIKRAADCCYKHPLKAIKLVKKAVRFISRANNVGALADAYFDLAVMYNRAHMPDRAILVLVKALDLYDQIEDQKNICLALLLKAHSLRRMQDYKEAFVTLKMVVKRAEEHNIPSLEAKGYKYMAEYFLGKNKYRSANAYLKKSYDLFEKCDLRDELDEVSTLFSYTKAWLRLHDVYYILFKVMSREDEEIFDFPIFAELGIPFYNRSFRLKFVYKLKDRYKPKAVDVKANAEQDTVSGAVQTPQENSDPNENREKTPEPPEILEPHCSTEDNQNLVKDQEPETLEVPEYFAFSDLTGLVFDEELDQAALLFNRLDIDANSEVVVRTLKNVPMQHRESKRSITNLIAMEIAGAQKLHCLKNRMYKLCVLVDKTQVERKMLLMNQQIDETREDDYEKQNDDELWKFTVEIHPSEPLDVYTQWRNNAHPISQNVGYHYDAKPKCYSRLLKGLLRLLPIYECYDKFAQEKPTDNIEVVEDRSDIEFNVAKSLTLDNVRKVDSSISKGTQSETIKPAKICRCKEPRRCRE